MPARRAAVGCMLNRLILLTAGNEPKLAELFARAELKRGNCASAATATSADWVTGADNPPLRGTLLRPGPSSSPRCWFSCNFSPPAALLWRECGPIDLVTICPGS